jgi:hypothetical protein
MTIMALSSSNVGHKKTPPAFYRGSLTRFFDSLNSSKPRTLVSSKTQNSLIRRKIADKAKIVVKL